MYMCVCGKTTTTTRRKAEAAVKLKWEKLLRKRKMRRKI